MSQNQNNGDGRVVSNRNDNSAGRAAHGLNQFSRRHGADNYLGTHKPYASRMITPAMNRMPQRNYANAVALQARGSQFHRSQRFIYNSLHEFQSRVQNTRIRGRKSMDNLVTKQRLRISTWSQALKGGALGQLRRSASSVGAQQAEINMYKWQGQQYLSHRRLRNHGMSGFESTRSYFQQIYSRKRKFSRNYSGLSRIFTQFIPSYSSIRLLLLGSAFIFGSVKLFKLGSVPIYNWLQGSNQTQQQSPKSTIAPTSPPVNNEPEASSSTCTSKNNYNLVDLKNRAQSFMGRTYDSYFKDLLEKGPVFYVWTLFWFRAFQEQFIHDALLKLLIGAVNDDRFVADSQQFGQDWCEYWALQKQVIDNSIVLSENVFVKSPDVVKGAQDFCVWFALQNKSQEHAALLVEKAGLSRDTFDIMMWQISCAFCQVNFSVDVQQIMQDELAKIFQRDSIAASLNEALQSQILDDMTYYLTLGFYDCNIPMQLPQKQFSYQGAE